MSKSCRQGESERAQRLARCCIFLAVCLCPTASAADRFSGSLSITSDYLYRGVSQSDGKLAVQGGVNARLNDDTANTWRVGIWGSTVEYSAAAGTGFELDSFVSYRHVLNADWQLRAAATHYGFIGAHSATSYNDDELSLTVNFKSRLLASIAWLPNAVTAYEYETQAGGFIYLARGSAIVTDLNFIQPLSTAWSATFGAGYYDYSGQYPIGYAYGHAGLTATYGPIDIDLLFVDSTHQAAEIYSAKLTGPRWAASVRWRF